MDVAIGFDPAIDDFHVRVEFSEDFADGFCLGACKQATA